MPDGCVLGGVPEGRGVPEGGVWSRGVVSQHALRQTPTVAMSKEAYSVIALACAFY